MNNIETLPGGTLFFTSGEHPVTTDSRLLARFAAECPAFGGPRGGASVCELGSGNGMPLLYLVDAGLCRRAVGVELSAGGAALLRAAVAENELVGVISVQADLRTYTSPAPFDAVLANPPYFTEGPPPESAARAAARHQGSATLSEVAAAAGRLLKTGGSLYLCYPPAKMPGLFYALAAGGLSPHTLRLVRKTACAAPWLLLLAARKGGGAGLRILPDLLLPGTGPETNEIDV